MRLRRDAGIARYEYLSDEALIALMSRNDTNALNAFYQRVSHLAYGLALRIVGDEQTAQNLVRDAFLKLWQQAPAYTQGGARAQLLATIHRSACDAAQYKPNAAGTGTDLSPVLTLERESAERVLIDLADDERTAIELAYYTGRNRTEIATQLALPLETITRLVSSGMTTLRTHNQANATPPQEAPHAAANNTQA